MCAMFNCLQAQHFTQSMTESWNLYSTINLFLTFLGMPKEWMQGRKLCSLYFFYGRNPEWGLRDVEELRQMANTNALWLERMVRGRSQCRQGIMHYNGREFAHAFSCLFSQCRLHQSLFLQLNRLFFLLRWRCLNIPNA